MKTIKRLTIPALLIVASGVIIAVGYLLQRRQPTLLQGVTMCRQYTAQSKIAGRIDSLCVTEGDSVTIGALLYTLSTPELDTKLEQAVAAKQAAVALDNQALAGARKQQIEAARNLYQKATAGRELAEKSFVRIKNLHDKGIATTQQLDEATATFEALKATQSAAYAEYSLALAGATKEQKAAAAAQVSMAQGAVNEVESYISDSRVYAPATGEVSTVAFNRGEVVGAGFPVVTILDLSDLWIEFNIKETLMPQIAVGERFDAFIPALNQHIELRVSYIAPQADFAVWNATRTEGGFDIRTFVVRMRPTATKSRLRPGMSAIIDLR
ncbi:MAG: efflux RND transporter periplasmic adaptor subunit [Alistipes sp.]|nr:efflux RND transporter periplasmic adaptor subunit [Alistipes sp.]